MTRNWVRREELQKVTWMLEEECKEHKAARLSLESIRFERNAIRTAVANYFAQVGTRHGENFLHDVERLILCAQAASQMHEEARLLLDQALTERDQALQVLADAPHAPGCWAYSVKTGLPDYPGDCNCWKAEL